MNLEELRRKALEEFERVHDLAALNAWRVRFLGRKSELALLLRRLSELPLEERRRLGGEGNALRHELEEKYRSKSRSLTAKEPSLSIDVTRPGPKYARGHLHPLTLVMRRVVEIFGRMGFAVAEGPEIETERNNFDALNIPQWHPARDLMDTFWLKPQNQKSKIKNKKNDGLLLRTHTSPVQIRYMETHQPPFRIIAPGRVYRHEATDARHEMQFHQIEGLMVGDDISLSNLKAIIEIFITSFFGPMAKLRVRPGYFPFVEPGVEFDLSCIGCYGKTPKCRLCGGSGWLEFAGAGMVHPNVFRAVGYNPQVLQGFAFGMGVERLAMIKYKIDDIRLFHSGDLRFIKQF
jgi:phenylalanyl-tRNA synthetase alpha chain